MMFVYLIPIIVLYFKYLYAFFMYGGEMVTYFQKDETQCISQLYYKLKKESGEQDPVQGRDLEFISEILKKGKYFKSVSETKIKFLENEKFYLRSLSLSEGTFIAHGFNSYIVKKKSKI